jgi:UV DNA damage endonuclease
MKESIRFRRATAAYLGGLPRAAQLRHLSAICLHNARALGQALAYCQAHGIGCFRINSQILPLKTHPEVGYRTQDLPDCLDIIACFEAAGRYCRQHDIRTTFHPDQFILLSSPSREVTRRSLADLAYQAEVAQWVRADVINIHAGGTYGSKQTAVRRLRQRLAQLPGEVRARLTLENDDRSYTPRDLLPLCREEGIPLVYDVHHHRCLPDGLSVAEATEQALQTWNREPLFHVSSPLHGWRRSNPRLHHDYVKPADFPACWRHLDITVEVEAKAKERAVLRLMRALGR